MRSVAAYALLASGSLAASVERRWDWPEGMSLEARQEPQPGDPRYLCHENCGIPITLAREEPNYCELEEYNTRLQTCLECANTFGIWMFYMGGNTASAAACGWTLVPSPSGWLPPVTSTSTSAAPSSSDEPVPSSSDAPGSPTTSDDPISQSSTASDSSSTPPADSSSEPPAVSGSATAVPSSSTASEPEQSASASSSDAVESSASASASGSATSAPAEESSGSPYPVPSDDNSSVHVPVPSGNATTLCTTTSGSGPYPTKGGDGYPSTPVSVPSGEPSFEASSATKVFGSFFGVAVAAVAVLAL